MEPRTAMSRHAEHAESHSGKSTTRMSALRERTGHFSMRDDSVQLGDLEEALDSFIDPLDPELLALQELAAVLACSDRRYLPEKYQSADRATLTEAFAQLKARTLR